MKISETKSEGLLREYKLVIPAIALAQKMEEKLLSLGKSVKIAGFRPGKVPMAVLKQRYADSVKGDVLEDALQSAIRHFIDEKKLKVALQPKVDVEKIEDGQDLTCAVTVELMPEITKVDLEKFTFNRLTSLVEEKAIEETLARIAESNKDINPAKEGSKARKGNIVHLAFNGTIAGKPIVGGSSTGMDLEIGSGMFIPGFEDQLIGLKVGESKTFNITFPDDYNAKDLAGKEATFDVEIKELKEASVPELNDALAQKLGLKDLQEFRENIRTFLQKDRDQMSFLLSKREVLDQFAESFTFEVPQGLVDLEFKAIWEQVQQESTEPQAANEKKPKKKDTKKDDAQEQEQYKKLAERRVRLGLLLAEIGKEHKVTVPDADLQRELYTVASRYPGQEKKVIEYYRDHPQALASLRAPLFEDKVIECILEKSKVTEKEIKVEELEKKVKDITEDDA